MLSSRTACNRCLCLVTLSLSKTSLWNNITSAICLSSYSLQELDSLPDHQTPAGCMLDWLKPFPFPAYLIFSILHHSQANPPHPRGRALLVVVIALSILWAASLVPSLDPCCPIDSDLAHKLFVCLFITCSYNPSAINLLYISGSCNPPLCN